MGAVLLALPALASEPTGLTPWTVDAFLLRAAGPDASDVRVNGLYGSGHSGAWQFVAHLTWRTRDGRIEGGTTALPQRAGAQADISQFDSHRLGEEESRGWTLAELHAATNHLVARPAPLEMLSLEIPAGSAGELTECRATGTGRAGCTRRNRTGDTARFVDRLVDQPALDALSVQRRAAPVTAPLP